MNLDKHIEQGLQHLDAELKRAKRCPICKAFGFSVDDLIAEWMLKPSRAYDLSPEDKRFLCNELSKRYIVPNNVCSLETHHISYELEITMPLCVECHKKVHNSDKEPWCKYKPIDKRKNLVIR
jgi:predicted Zn-ribbon and HTH transcriptional regulator